MASKQSHLRRAAITLASREKAVRRSLEAARSAWESLSIEIQTRLARELVLSRGIELKLAYRNVVSLGHGFRTKGKRRKLVRNAIVVKFIVRRKWDKKRPPKRRGPAIPSELLIYDGPEENRRLYAVSTDVECGQRYRQMRPLTLYTNPFSDGHLVSGAMACVVTIPNQTNHYGISCEHVLGLTDFFYPNDAPADSIAVDGGTAAPPAPDGPTVGETSTFRGYLVDHEKGFSIDSSLCAVSRDSAISQVLPAPRPTAALAESEPCPAEFVIWTPRAGPANVVQAKYVYDHPVQYSTASGLIWVTHPVLIESVFTAEHGDSGSPAITSDGGKLIGMILSGYEDSCWLMPAWAMLDGENYHGLSTGTTLQLTAAY
jgi:hypothetical protein